MKRIPKVRRVRCFDGDVYSVVDVPTLAASKDVPRSPFRAKPKGAGRALRAKGRIR